MIFLRCVNNLLAYGANDIVHPGEVVRVARWIGAAKSDNDVFKLSLSILHFVLNHGFMKIGDYANGGFQPWDILPSKAVERVRYEWADLKTDPGPGDLFWLQNSKAGNERAQLILPLQLVPSVIFIRSLDWVLIRATEGIVSWSSIREAVCMNGCLEDIDTSRLSAEIVLNLYYDNYIEFCLLNVEMSEALVAPARILQVITCLVEIGRGKTNTDSLAMNIGVRCTDCGMMLAKNLIADRDSMY